MALTTTVGPATSGPQRIRAAAIATASTQVADDTDGKVSISVQKGGRVVLQVVSSGGGWTAGSVYLTADAGAGAMSPTGTTCTAGRSGQGIEDLIANYDMEVGCETGADFTGQALVLLKTLG